ncbi:MAG: hypothetical protein L6265_02835, partial [Thermoplasmatales archaeon]|nr:hypothetical protein [Thermoplasmatales archaeon]
MLYCSTLGGMMDMIGKNICRILAVLIAVTFLLPAGVLGSMEFEVDGGAVQPRINHDFHLYLKAGTFDPVKGERASIGNDMRLSSPNGYFIVQLNCPQGSEYKQEIEALGGHIHGYIPNDAYLVSMTTKTKNEISRLSYIRWIGNYEPGYKISPNLNGKTGNVKLNVVLFEAEERGGILGFAKEKPLFNKGTDVQNMNNFIGVADRESKDPREETKLDSDAKLKRDRLDTSGIEKYTAGLQDKLTVDGRTMMGNLPMNKWSDQSLWEISAIQKIEELGGKVEYVDSNILKIEIDASKINKIAFMDQVEWIELGGELQHFMTNQRQAIGAEPLTGETDDHPHTFGYDGNHADWDATIRAKKGGDFEVVTVYALDGVDQTHPEFDTGTRKKANVGGTSIVDEHGTACLGIMIAKGIKANAKGMVPDAHWCLGATTWATSTELSPTNVNSVVQGTRAQGGVPISVSWGLQGVDYYGVYTLNAQYFDDAIYNYNALIFGAAGNAGPEKTEGNGNAKNIVSVGGTKNQDTPDPSDDVWEGGGVGPSNDGRVKPDMVADFGGANTGSLFDIYTTDTVGSTGYSPDDPNAGITGDPDYCNFAGTSAAAPQAAGTGGIYTDMWCGNHFGNSPSELPSAACLKALMISDAYHMSLTGATRYQQGWGMVNAERAYQVAEQHYIFDEGQALGSGGTETHEWSTTISSVDMSGYDTGLTGLRIVLVWTDPTAASTSGKQLVNDLDLKVTQGGTTYYGNLGMDISWNTATSGTNPWNDGSSSTVETDDLNNVECVFIPAPSGNYTITVKASDTATTQNFAIIASGVASGTGRVFLKGESDINKKGEYNYDDKAKIILTDANLNLNPSAVDAYTNIAHINSTKDPTGFDITVTETGVNTNTFTAEIKFSKSEPVGVNFKMSYPAYNILDVYDEGDTIWVTYNDAGPVPQTVTAVGKYDGKAPRITNVTVTETTYSSFTVEFDTDGPAYGFLDLQMVDSNITDNDYYSNEWEYYGIYPATIDEIRDGKTNNQFYYYDGPITHHKFTMYENYPNMTYLFGVSAQDAFGNYIEDTNMGNFYSAHTQNQPFKILTMFDGSSASVYETYSLMIAGYYAYLGVGSGAKQDDWNGTYNFTNYFNPIGPPDNCMKFDDYWNATVADTYTNGTDNIVIWETGYACSHIATQKATYNAVTGAWALKTDFYDVVNGAGYTYNTTEIAKLSDFHDKGGNLVCFGAGIHEDATARAEVNTFLQNYLHAQTAATATATYGNLANCSQGYDVPAGWHATTNATPDWDTHGTGWIYSKEKDTSYTGIEDVGMKKVAGANVAYMDYTPQNAMSGDELAVYGTGAQEELAWDVNTAGTPFKPSPKWAAISYAGGTPERKTFVSGAGDGSFYYYLTMQSGYYAGPEVLGFWQSLVKWMAPNGYLGKTGISGTVKVGATGLVNATVEAYAVGDTTKVLGADNTNASGNYQINITAGTYDIIAKKGGYTTAKISSVLVTTGIGITTGQNLVLSAAGGIKGTVKVFDPVWKEIKVSGVRIKAEGSVTKEVYTDAGSYYIEDLPAGAYTVTAYTSWYVNSTYIYNHGVESTSSSAAVTAGTYQTVDFTLRTGSVSGRVTDAGTGKAIKNAYVYVVESDISLEQDSLDECNSILKDAFTDEQGYFYFSFIGNNTKGYRARAEADGEYIISVYNSTTDTSHYEYEAYGYYNETYNEGTPATFYASWGQETANIDFTLDTSLGSITGTVVNVTGVKCVGGWVKAVLDSSTATQPGYAGTANAMTYINPDGSYRFDKLINGTYNITAGWLKHLTDETAHTGINAVTVTAGTTTSGINFALSVNPAVSILVVDKDKRYDAISDSNVGIGPGEGQQTWDYFVKPMFDALGYTYDVWDTGKWDEDGVPDAAYMLNYEIIVYFCDGPYNWKALGTNQEPLRPSEQAALLDVVNNNGGIWIIGLDIIYSLNGQSSADMNPVAGDWLYDVCGVDYVVQDVDGLTSVDKISPTSGITGDVIGNGLGPYTKDYLRASGNDYHDHLTPVPGCGQSWKTTNTIEPGTANVDVHKPATLPATTGKSVFMADSLSAFSEADGIILVSKTIEFLKPDVMSNKAPILSGGYVTPETGAGGATYTFGVNYTDYNNHAPSYIRVVIDPNTANEQNFTMTKITGGTDYSTGKLYKYVYSAGLSEGEHNFRFETSDGSIKGGGDTGNHTGPTINDVTLPIITVKQGLFSVATDVVAQANATITDNLKIDSATLWWRMNTSAKAVGPWQSRDMTLSGSQLDP